MLAPILQQQQQQNGSNSNGSIASTSNGYGHHSLLNGDRQQHLQQQQQQPKLFSYKLVQLQHSYTGLPFGFTNEGNYCYMISVLQSLLHTPAFINFVLSSHVSTCRIVPSVDKWCAVCEFVRYYKRYSCGPGSACYPRAFMNRLSAISPTMRLNRQEDAHEFLRGLLDYMESNCLHGYTGAESKRASNPIRVLFCGKLKSSVLCSKCGAQSQTFDDFMDLSLCIQSSNNLIDCLQRFVSADLLKDSNAYKCEKCRTKVTAMKSFSIAVGPPILTIQLNRFQWGHNSKISRFVEFPLSLDLRPFMSKRGRPVQYDLYSVVIHHGFSTKFGHYYCYAKRNEAWWCLNDASVERISETRVLNSCPYILFYRRTDLSALVNNNSNSSNGARPVSTVDAPHPTPPIAAAPPIPASSIPTSQTAAVRSIPSTSTIRVLVSSAASPIQSTITSTTSSGPMFTPRPVFVLRNNSSNGNCNGSGSVSSGSSTSSGSKTDLLQFMSARNVNSSCYSSKSNNGSTSDSTAQAAAAQAGNRELLVSYGSPSQSPSHSSASAAASPSSTCIRLKIHKVEGNKFSCVPVPLQQQQQQQQKQQLVMQLTPPQPTKSVVASASAPVDARASARTPPPSYQLPAASNSEPQQQQQRHQQSSNLKRKASQDQSSSSPSSSEYDWVECCSGPAAAEATAAAASAAAAHSAHNSAKEDCNSDSDDSSSSSDRETAKKRSKRHHHQQHDRRHSRRQNHHKRHKRKSSHHKSRRRSSSRSHRHNHHNQ